MVTRREIVQALSTPFDAAAQGLDPSKYFGLAVWHDGPTLEESWITISTEYNGDTGTLTKSGKWIPTFDLSGETQIDIFDKKGTGKGTVKDINKLKAKFKRLTKILPPGEYQLNADHPTKARLYMREFLKEPWFSKSGQTSRGVNLSDEEKIKLKKKGIPLEYETMVMNVPEDATRIGTGKSQSGLHLGSVPDDVVNDEFKRYIQGKYNQKTQRVEDNSFVYQGKRYGFESAGDNKRALMHDGGGYKLYRAGDKQIVEANRKARQKGLTPQMSIEEWLDIRHIYHQAADLGLEVDHIQPIDIGGLHHPSNLQLLTRKQNREKGTRYASVRATKQLEYSDQAQPIKPRLGASAKDYKWAQKMTQNNTTLKHIDGFTQYGRKADIYANIGANLASGNTIGAAAGLAPLALTTKPVQKGIFHLAKKFGAKRAAALAPGVGAGIAGLETAGYLGQGRNIQAGIAAVSGVTGEIPILEPVSIAADLSNTVIDYLTGNYKADTDYDPNKRGYDIPNRSTLSNLGLNWRNL